MKRSTLLWVLVAIVVVLSFETIRFSEMSSMRRTTKHRLREDILARQQRALESQSPDEKRAPSRDDAPRVVEPTIAPTASAPLRGGLLDIALPAANVSAVCPLPVLHPWKWQDKMTWGVRKRFSPCEVLPHTASFSFISANGNTVELDVSRCPEGGVILGFKELEDSSLPRLQTVMDAEMRQNELRERFAQDSSYSFATLRKLIGRETHWKADDIFTPYVLVVCGTLEHPRGKQLHVRAQVRDVRKKRHAAKRSRPMDRHESATHGPIQNIIHLMFDSTSVHAFRRSATRTMKWLERMNNAPEGSSRVFTQKHYHSVSCCSPGNQVPMYAGVINGEGDRFVASEPHRDSRSWLWNIADGQGFTTFWSLDNCPDKSARDYHASPSVDVRVVAPLCLAGVLLSHKELECLGGRTVDEHVFQGLRSFWHLHKEERKFATVQFITPHEETEKQIVKLDETTAAFFSELEAAGEWNNTALVFWSDHGINFGKYATTHDGEFEKLLPFAHVMLPRWLVDDERPDWGTTLRANQDRLVTPFDMYELSRSLIYYPQSPPSFASSRDARDPPLPRPSESHIMASFQKEVTPVNLLESEVSPVRDCAAANIPVEFCTCIPWRELTQARDAAWWDRGTSLVQSVLAQHRNTIANVSTAAGYRQGLCQPLGATHVVSMELQEWPLSYKPKEQPMAKRVWMMPNRDMLRLRYTHKETSATFEAIVSVDKERPGSVFDVAKIDRLDAMKKKCGVVDKTAEHLCECR